MQQNRLNYWIQIIRLRIFKSFLPKLKTLFNFNFGYSNFQKSVDKFYFHLNCQPKIFTDKKIHKVEAFIKVREITIFINRKHMESEKIHVNEITARASSKKEIYRMLHLEGDVFLPPLAHANHDYVSGVLSGAKKVGLPLIML